MHPEAIRFMNYVKQVLPDFFKNKTILDVGSGDINGNNSYLFECCDYNGNDVVQAKNVTIVSRTKDLPFQSSYFNTIISTECFEHDPEYRESLLKIYDMLKPNGLFAFTCASIGRREHGTQSTSPIDSFGCIGNIPDMVNYYKNLTINDINDVLDLSSKFIYWKSYYNNASCDLYFIGIKLTNDQNYVCPKIPDYIG